MEIISRAVCWTSLVSFPLFIMAVPPAMAGSIGSCADNLIANGVTKSAAAKACSDAVNPNDLSSCVEQIKTGTNIKGNEVLQACYRVRRPQELANCVTSISDNSAPGKSAMVLDSCRRSLLPTRHAECTMDLASVSEISTEEAMNSCIAAELTPSMVDPAKDKAI